MSKSSPTEGTKYRLCNRRRSLWHSSATQHTFHHHTAIHTTNIVRNNSVRRSHTKVAQSSRNTRNSVNMYIMSLFVTWSHKPSLCQLVPRQKNMMPTRCVAKHIDAHSTSFDNDIVAVVVAVVIVNVVRMRNHKVFANYFYTTNRWHRNNRCYRQSITRTTLAKLSIQHPRMWSGVYFTEMLDEIDSAYNFHTHEITFVIWHEVILL